MTDSTIMKKRLKAIREEKKLPRFDFFLKKCERVRKNLNLKIINILNLFRGKKDRSIKTRPCLSSPLKIISEYTKGALLVSPFRPDSF